MIFGFVAQIASTIPTDASALESSISTLEREIRTLESSSIPFEHWLPWVTGVVALGVAMELWVIWHDRREGVAAWGRGVIRSPEKPSRLKFIVELASVILITVGIVGELWLGLKITSINGVLRSKNAELRSESDQLLALVTQEAGSAKHSAEGAAAEATRAKENADAAARLVDDERSKRIKLAKLVSPRSLTEQDMKDIADELRPVADPKVKIEVVTTSGNGLRLGILIWNALKAAGYRPVLQPSNRVFYETNVGGPLEYWPTVEVIEKALVKKVGLAGPTPILSPGSPVRITVGETMPSVLPPELLGNPPRTNNKRKATGRK